MIEAALVMRTPGPPHDGSAGLLARLRQDHDGIRATVTALSALVEEARMPAIDPLATLRWRLVRQIVTHLPLEDSYVCQPLEEDARPAVAHLAAAFRREFESLYADFLAHVRWWTGSAILMDWAGYQASFPPLRDRLLVRMDREEAELYPLVDPHRPYGASRRRDWTRDAGLLHDAIDPPGH